MTSVHEQQYQQQYWQHIFQHQQWQQYQHQQWQQYRQHQQQQFQQQQQDQLQHHQQLQHQQQLQLQWEQSLAQYGHLYPSKYRVSLEERVPDYDPDTPPILPRNPHLPPGQTMKYSPEANELIQGWARCPPGFMLRFFEESRSWYPLQTQQQHSKEFEGWLEAEYDKFYKADWIEFPLVRLAELPPPPDASPIDNWGSYITSLEWHWRVLHERMPAYAELGLAPRPPVTDWERVYGDIQELEAMTEKGASDSEKCLFLRRRAQLRGKPWRGCPYGRTCDCGGPLAPAT